MKRVIGSILVAAGVACADTLNVPGDYPTIQGAINAATGGDVVLVADGTYSGPGNVNLDTLGKAITVKSKGGAGLCVIDGQSAARGFVLQTGEGPSTRIEGFTIKDGFADLGGGIYTNGSSPTIVGCVITGGNATQGGGMYSDGGAPVLIGCSLVDNHTQTSGGGAMLRASVTLIGCTISDNVAGEAGDGSSSGGLGIGEGTSRLVGCLIEGNVAHGDVSADSSSGGVGAGGSVTYEDCAFIANRADVGGAVSAGFNDPQVFIRCVFRENRATYGAGAAHFAFGNAAFTDCRFENNSVLDGTGGAVSSRDGAGDVTFDVAFDRCMFVGNSSRAADFGHGGGAISTSGNGETLITNCVFAGNSETREGSGGALIMSPEDRVVNCVFYGNTADQGEGAALVGGSESAVTNSIFWSNGPVPIAGAVNVSYSDVEGGFAGPGNIDADPKFFDVANLDFHLTAGSPCIDAGSNPAVPNGIEADLDGAPRFHDDPGTPDTGLGTAPIVDIGALEFGSVACYADFTGDGVLDLFDFLAYVNAFNEGDLSADCATDDALDLFDFLCFVNAFNEGC